MIEDLIKAAEDLCDSLEKSSQNEKLFYDSIREDLEYVSFKMTTTKNDLKTIKEYDVRILN